jgi:hypothetical protein
MYVNILLYTFSTLNTLEWYFLVWPNRPDLLAKITGLGLSVQEYLNSCFARLCSFYPSDVENTSPQWYAFGSWCANVEVTLFFVFRVSIF